MKKYLVVFSIISLIFTFSFFTFRLDKVHAAALTSVKDTMSRMKASTASNHTIQFTTPTGQSSGTIVIDFNTAGFTSGSVDYTDIDLSYGAAGTENEQTLAAAAAAATWGAAFATNSLTLTYPTSGGTAITAGWIVIVEIGTNATAGVVGDQQMTNPTAGASKIISITAGSDSGSLAVAILADEQLAVTGDIDETLSFALSSNTMALATMTTSAVASVGPITLTMSTNASGGYTITVQDQGDGSSAGLYKSAAPTGLIASSTATLAAGTEGYGAQGASATETVATTYLKTTNDVGALSRTAQNLVSNTIPVSAKTATITVKAAISGTTKAGNYADTLTLICTGNF